MLADWPSFEVGEILIDGTRNGIYKTKEFHGSGVKIVNMGELFAHPRLYDVPMKRVELTEGELRKAALEPGDLLFARRSLVAEGAGKCSIVMEVKEPTTFESSVIRARPDSGKVDSLFLYYLFNSPVGRYLLGTILRQVAVSGITGTDLVKLRITLPPLKEQQAIAHILGTLDDKIQLNRRMNETLESIARAIFKSWFVDFDPVRAKADGHQPVGMDVETATLFPDLFEESEMGKIPSGWTVGSIGEVCEVIDCLHSKKPLRQEEGKPFLQLCNIRDDGLIDMTDTFYISEDDYVKWVSRIEASQGDCVITNVGRVGAVGQVPEGLKAALGRNMTGIRPKHIFPCPTFLIQCLLSKAMKDEILLKTDTGTILDALNVKDIPRLRFVQPGDSLLKRFEEACRPLRARMQQSLSESGILAGIRDTLLPKLISGEIRVKDAENIVEEHAG